MLAEAPPAALVAPAPARIVAGRSAEGRAIVARRPGAGRAPRRAARRRAASTATSPAPRAPIAALRRARLPPGVAVWTVRVANPDGLARGRAPERPRRRPQPQLPRPLARERPARRSLLARPGRRRRSPRRACSCGSCSACSPTSRSTTTSPTASSSAAAASTCGARPPLRRALRAAAARAAGLPRHGRGLAERAATRGSALVVELRAGTVGDRAAERHAAAALAVARPSPRAS